MAFDHSRIWPYVIALLAVFAIYRRLRRNFGRQRLRPVRMRLRMALLAFVACCMVPLALKSGQFAVAEATGLAAGIALGLWAAGLTRYQSLDGQLYYVPHTYTGIAVSLLFAGRLVYRLVSLSAARENAAPSSALLAAPTLPPPMTMQGAVTAGVLAVVIGYYVCYYGRVLARSKHIGPQDLEAPSPSSAVIS
jgi:hypothetical protein